MENKFLRNMPAPDGIHDDDLQKNPVEELSKWQEIGMLVGSFIGGAIAVAVFLMEAYK